MRCCRMWHLIWVYTVCSCLSVWIHTVNMVESYTCSLLTDLKGRQGLIYTELNIDKSYFEENKTKTKLFWQTLTKPRIRYSNFLSRICMSSHDDIVSKTSEVIWTLFGENVPLVRWFKFMLLCQMALLIDHHANLISHRDWLPWQ